MPTVRAMALASLAALAACDGEERFDLVFDDLESTLFSVWGSGPDDVWAVGADAGDGPLVLRFDGQAWSRVDTGATGDLWWVSGRGDSVWMSGEAGLIIRYTYGTDEFEVMRAPEAENMTLFGIYPIADDEVWAVGGVRDGDGSEGRAYRWDGSAWGEVVDLPAEASEAPLFKVWGRGSDDLWIVGLGEAAFHRDADGWSVIPTDRRLLTVHGNDERVFAVGGFASGYVVELQEDGAADVTPPGMEEMTGVWVQDDGTVLTAGAEGAMWSQQDGAWARVLDAPQVPGGLAYHAVFVDAAGDAWAVGGELLVRPFAPGVLSHRGPPISSEIR